MRKVYIVFFIVIIFTCASCNKKDSSFINETKSSVINKNENEFYDLSNDESITAFRFEKTYNKGLLTDAAYTSLFGDMKLEIKIDINANLDYGLVKYKQSSNKYDTKIKEFDIKKLDIDKLLKNLEDIDFWNLDPYGKIMNLDGGGEEMWIIEGVQNGKYKRISRLKQDIDTTELVELGELFMNLNK